MPKRIHSKCLHAIVILNFFGWNKSEIADALNIDRRTVCSRLKTLGICTATYLENLEVSLPAHKLIVQLLRLGMKQQRIHCLFRHELPRFTSITQFRNYTSRYKLLEIHIHHNTRYIRQCLHCGEFFIPDCRHRLTQQFCSSPSCQTASKKYSQQKWSQGLGKDYWK